MATILHLGKSSLPKKPITDDDVDRISLCLKVLSECSPLMNDIFNKECRQSLSHMLSAKLEEEKLSQKVSYYKCVTINTWSFYRCSHPSWSQKCHHLTVLVSRWLVFCAKEWNSLWILDFFSSCRKNLRRGMWRFSQMIPFPSCSLLLKMKWAQKKTSSNLAFLQQWETHRGKRLLILLLPNLIR